MTTEAPSFHHTDTGTSEATWLGSDRWDGVGVLDLDAVLRRFTEVLVVAAHPDDETLGVGGLLADLSDAGASLHVLVATDGERSHPVADDAARAALAARRRDEVEGALRLLAPGARVTHLGLPDTRLDRAGTGLRDAVAQACGPQTLVIAPWVADGHADHDALGRAAAAAAASSGAAAAHYPIWLWHWSTPDDLPWQLLVAVEPSREALQRKRSALEEFRTQTTPRGGPEAGDATGAGAAVLGGPVLERAHRLLEVLLDPAGVLPVLSEAARSDRPLGRTATLDAMYDRGDDPWQLEGSFYEDRRRALVLGVLGHRQLGRVLEVGCADGRLTAELLRRADAVVALDTSPRAVRAARTRAPSAEVHEGTAPHDLPAGPFDLVVLSEVGYFLTPLELLATLRRCAAALAPGGELLLCHWQHPTTDVPLDGRLVHDQAASQLGLHRRASYADEDLRIEVWGDGPSLALREGRG
ncbi:PIG-L family deacetylase [Oryzobacter terrae]|uniref:PIG-L family deacetylase n=1 Tax=Oryzobacter terrae TaxID=1620385 RepID=UPI00366FDDC1